jgi:Domain of Unknown Function (DUF1080)
MRYIVKSILIASAIAALIPIAFGQEKGKAYTDPAKVDEDFALQGEYSGEVKTQDGDLKVGAQVIALGDGKFRMVGFHGGLPGDGWNGTERREAEGSRTGGRAEFEFDGNSVVVEKGSIVITDGGGAQRGELKKVERKSPSLGKKPPEGAVVLFDGKKSDAWEKARLTDDGLLMQGATSKQKFGSHSLHVEFRLPYQPTARGQARGNSGLYLQGRYEVQMLDSFGLEGKNNECGGIYTIAEPSVNMCFPPLAWQTYDIDYTAAVYEGGKKIKNPRVTVKHNGVTIHDNVELTHSTTASPLKEGPEPGPVYLQDHGNPVRYRNIWVVEKK